MPRVLIVEGPLKGQAYEISDGATVGRSRSCTVRIEGRHVSRIHCKFEKRGEQFVVLDNDSRNGIFVNGHKVKEKPLAGDDEVEVGEYVLVFEPSPELVAAVSGGAKADTQPPAPSPAGWQAVVQPEGDQGTSRRDFARIRAATTVLDSILEPFGDGVSNPAGLVDIVRAVSAADEDAPALKALLDRLVDGMKATRGFIMLADDRGKLTPSVKRAPANDDEFYLSNVLFHQIAREKRAVLATDTSRKGANAGKPVSIVAAPMISRGAVLGFVYLESPAEEGQPPKPRFTNADLRFVAAAAAMAAPTLALMRRASKSLRAYDSARRRIELHHRIIGENPALKQVTDMLAAIAPTDAGVLLTGERGTGKSLVARAMHARSARALQPFLAVNCAAIAPSLVASELFGHEKNAFPGATEQKRGLLELAHGGTLYLMEVGELPSEAQATILRVLEGHGFSRMGGTERIHADVRLLGSTTHDLEKEMQAGKIKKELYWNLATTVLKLPPLRERRDDVPRLVRYFLEQEGGRASGIVEDHIAPELLQSMTLAPWPGNVAELRVAVEQMLLLAGTARITPEHWKK